MNDDKDLNSYKYIEDESKVTRTQYTDIDEANSRIKKLEKKLRKTKRKNKSVNLEASWQELIDYQKEGKKPDKNIVKAENNLKILELEYRNFEEVVNNLKNIKQTLENDTAAKREQISELDKMREDCYEELRTKREQAEQDAKDISSSLEAEGRNKATNLKSQAQALLDETREALEKQALGFHVEAFLSRLEEVDEMAVKDQEAMFRLYIAMKKALETAQGVAPQEHDDLDKQMLTTHKIDALYRFYSAKIKAVKEDHNLDEDIKSAQLLGLTETMERQVQALSGAFEADM